MNSEVSRIPSTSLDFSKANHLCSDARIIHNMQLVTLPESIIHQVFSYLTHPELLQAQRVNKQFYRLIRRSIHLLCRPEVMEMGCEKRIRPFGRLQTSFISKTNKRRRLFIKFIRRTSSTVKCRELFQDEDYTGDRNDLSENLLNYLDQQFKEANINGILSFSGIAITTNLYNRLCKNWVKIDNATRLVFTLCHFRLPLKYFCELLMRTNCQRLTIELSHFEQCLLDDFVLEAMPECQELILSSATPLNFPQLTDRSLHRWAIQEKLPGKIFFRNIRTNFTFDGVLILVNALQIRHPDLFSSTIQPIIPDPYRKKTSYDWDFGCITLPEQNQGSNIVELLSTPGVITHISRSNNSVNAIDVTINSKDFYLSTAKCQVSIRLQLIISSQKYF